MSVPSVKLLCMSAAEEKIILSRIRAGLAWLTPLLFILAALVALASGLAGLSSASAKTLGVPQNRAWGNSAGMLQSRPVQTPQSLELQRENSIGRYDLALDDTLAAESTAVRTNADLVQEIGTRADAWATRQGLTGTPQQLGTWEHTYARDLLERYQSLFGDRGLVTERSWLGKNPAAYGTPASVRLDVFEPNTGTVWDYKFGVTSMSAAQRARIMANVPGVTSITEVRP